MSSAGTHSSLTLSSVASVLRSNLNFRNAFIILCLLNLKTLPFSWHIRLLYRFIRAFYTPNVTTPKMHAIFAPSIMTSRSPLTEIDYNLHKSNSTYFSDLDETRTALVTRLLAPAMRKRDKTLEEQGFKGPIRVILGSVHTTFHKETKAYEKYELRSRVLGWDKKWLVIGTWFVRPAKNGREEVLLASSLSKYVVKKGRYTVSPEKCLMGADLLPPKPEGTHAGADHRMGSSEESAEGTVAESGVLVNSTDMTSTNDTPQSGPEDITAPLPEQAIAAAQVVDKLEKVASRQESEPKIDLQMSQAPMAAEWDWYSIDRERLRGLQKVQHWLDLDKIVKEEFESSRQSQAGEIVAE